MELISIIVPVYKAEKSIRDCIMSLCNQTYRNIEILIIDDGSPDKSGEICDEFALKDKRIKVIHKQNEGVSAARNTGLDIAKGKYVGFVDSDDEIEASMFENLWNDINKSSVQIAICGYYNLESNGLITKSDNNKEIEIMTALEITKRIFTSDKINGFMWNKLFDRELFNDIRFSTELEVCEDLYVVCQILSKDIMVSYNPRCLYYYKTNDLSATNDLSRLFSESYKSKYSYAYNLISLLYKEEEMKNIIKASFAKLSMNLLFKIRLKGVNLNNGILNNLKKDIKENIKFYIKCKDISLTQKAKRLMIHFIPSLVIYRIKLKQLIFHMKFN